MQRIGYPTFILTTFNLFISFACGHVLLSGLKPDDPKSNHVLGNQPEGRPRDPSSSASTRRHELLPGTGISYVIKAPENGVREDEDATEYDKATISVQNQNGATLMSYRVVPDQGRNFIVIDELNQISDLTTDQWKMLMRGIYTLARPKAEAQDEGGRVEAMNKDETVEATDQAGQKATKDKPVSKDITGLIFNSPCVLPYHRAIFSGFSLPDMWAESREIILSLPTKAADEKTRNSDVETRDAESKARERPQEKTTTTKQSDGNGMGSSPDRSDGKPERLEALLMSSDLGKPIEGMRDIFPEDTGFTIIYHLRADRPLEPPPNHIEAPVYWAPEISITIHPDFKSPKEHGDWLPIIGADRNPQ